MCGAATAEKSIVFYYSTAGSSALDACRAAMRCAVGAVVVIDDAGLALGRQWVCSEVNEAMVLGEKRLQ